jgi:hypothetical protein
MPRRGARVLLCGLLAAATVATAGSCQTRWRTEDFLATGQPFVVADVPGYRLDSTYADAGAIFLTYTDVAGRRMTLDAVIAETCTDYFGPAPGQRCLDLPGDHVLAIGVPHGIGNDAVRGTLPDVVTVRQVSAEYLAGFEVSVTSRPD